MEMFKLFICCWHVATSAAVQVHISSKQIAKMIGKVFIEKSAVNLLSSVLDTPEVSREGQGDGRWYWIS